MKICLISSIFHGFGKIGGFGVMTRQLAKGLAQRGYEVTVVVPRKKGQKKRTELDGYTILGVSMCGMINPFLYKSIDADIYHSQSPNLMSTAAMFAKPQAVHIITCRDPRNLEDWKIEIRDATFKRKLKNYGLMFFEEGPLVKWTIRKADITAYVPRFIKKKIKEMYGVKREPVHLSNIEEVPQKIPVKAKKPTVLFLGRLDKRKRPEIYFELAKKFPNVKFLVIGKAEDETRDKEFLELSRNINNINHLGYIDKYSESEKFYYYINKSWILINTASREAFPLTFFEAGSRGCAILSHVNPDNLISNMGYWAKNDDDFEKGLQYLLEKQKWKVMGKKAHDYFKKETYKSLDKHISLYKEQINKKKHKR